KHTGRGPGAALRGSLVSKSQRGSELSSRPKLKNPAKREPEAEWSDPENASFAMPIRGVLKTMRGMLSAKQFPIQGYINGFSEQCSRLRFRGKFLGRTP